MFPKISVIMPVYNASKYLREAIDSVLNQTFTDFELLILNDCSTDDSAEIIKEYAQKDTRIRFMDQEQNLGPSLLRNKGIENATGNYIALLDADDIALPTRFEKQLEILSNSDTIGVCGSWYTLFGDGIENQIIKTIDNPALVKINFLDNNNIGNSTVMLKKEVLGDLRFNPDFVPVEDYELWARLILKTDFYNIPESLVMYRWHQNNITQTKKENTERSLRNIKINQFKSLQITIDDSNYEHYKQAFELQLKNDANKVLGILKAVENTLEQNKKLRIYHQEYLQEFLEKIALKSVRKAKNCNLTYYRNLQKEQWVLKKIPFLKRVGLFCNCLLQLQ